MSLHSFQQHPVLFLYSVNVIVYGILGLVEILYCLNRVTLILEEARWDILHIVNTYAAMLLTQKIEPIP